MASNIDPNQPEQGNPTTLSVRGNFQAAADEITSLQSRADALEAGTSISYATTSAQGVVELAEVSEVDTGTDNTLAITPLGLATSALAGSVATNTADIATNTADIATNTADIATNTGDITTLEGRTLTAGSGLTGGGSLAANRTFNVGAGTGISVTADAVAFDTSWGDARYLQSFTEADTLATVTGRGASTGTSCTFTSDVTVNGTLNVRTAIDLADNDILRFGTGDDCELFCNGSHMYMDLNTGIGNFYIRDGTTTRFTFDDAGSFTATNNITAYSDRRIKKNIEPIVNAIDKVQQLAGYTYNKTTVDGDYAGVIAQEVQEVLPEAVKENEDGILSVDYNAVLALTLQAVNELVEEVRGSK